MVVRAVMAGTLPAGERFRTPDEAWFWTCGALAARRQGQQRHVASVRRNCDPDDVLLCLERLLRAGRLTREHARVMGRWGMLGFRPSAYGPDAREALLWKESMAIVAPALAGKDIIAR